MAPPLRVRHKPLGAAHQNNSGHQIHGNDVARQGDQYQNVQHFRKFLYRNPFHKASSSHSGRVMNSIITAHPAAKIARIPTEENIFPL